MTQMCNDRNRLVTASMLHPILLRNTTRGCMRSSYPRRWPSPAPAEFGPAGHGGDSIVGTTFCGQAIDPEVPAGFTITTAGLEREAGRGEWLVFIASMLDRVRGESSTEFVSPRWRPQ